MTTPNKALILSAIPTGLPVPNQDLKTINLEPINLSNPPPPGGILVKTHYISYDPYQRGKMRDPATSKSYFPAYTIGEPLDNAGISTVLKSNNEKFREGDLVTGYVKFQEYDVVGKERLEVEREKGGFEVLENPLGLDIKIYLGALGMSGLTAYSSLYAIGKPKKGETIFISAASGAVGGIVGQLSKREGLRVIGSVGSDEKLKFIVEELGFDGGFNYKKEKPEEALERFAPNGVDIYYDNVGGEHLDAALVAMNNFGRIIACGSVSQSSLEPKDVYGVKNMRLVVGKRLTIRGFIVFDKDIGPLYHDEHQKDMQKWIKNGEIKVKLSVTEGINNAAVGLVGMLKGENFGKALLKISDH